MDKQGSISSLMHKGFSPLRSHHYRDALALGRKLKRLRHSSAFEIIALAYLLLDALPKTIGTLEEGVTKAGRVWLLWELLGNCYSDAKRYNAAEQAYQQALLQPDCDPDVVHLNRAIALERAGKLRDAWSAIDKVKAPRLCRRADEVRMRISHALGHKREAVSLALRLSRRRASAADLDPQSESSILTACARVLRDSSKTLLEARSLAYRAIRFNYHNTESLQIIRELENHHSANSSLCNLLIQGTWDEPFGKAKTPLGFYRSCQVYAPDHTVALRCAKRFFPPGVRPTLRIEESKAIPCEALRHDGVCSL